MRKQTTWGLVVSQLKARKLEKLEEIKKFESVLLEKKDTHIKVKKIDTKASFDYLTDDLKQLVVSDTSKMKFKSHNLQKQRIEFLRATFCKYDVPIFMLINFPFHFNMIRGNKFGSGYRMICRIDIDKNPHADLFNGPNNFDLNNITFYQDIFKIIASGSSLRRYLKGTLTAKECGVFLSLKNDYPISANIWLARLIHYGFDKIMSYKLYDRLFSNFDELFFEFDLVNIMQFFMTNYKDMDNEVLSDILDFVRHKLVTDVKFTLKGRTVQSVIELSNQWHKERIITNPGVQNARWDRIEEEDRVINYNDGDYKFVELTTTRELFSEGRTQHHCVGTYLDWCISGKCSIFSMRYTTVDGDKKSVTIEIQDKTIRQARGKCNAKPNHHEYGAIMKWSEGHYKFNLKDLY